MIRVIRSFALPLLIGASCFSLSAWAHDPVRGEQVLRDQNCLSCHSVGLNGSITAPDLAHRPPADDTIADLASRIWNHTPLMAPAIAEDQVPVPRMTERDAEDLFTYLFALHYPNERGDARQGRQLFQSKNCSSCHSLNLGEKQPLAKPMVDWKNLSGSFALVQEMWNHAPFMKNALAKRSQPMFSLTGQEVADLTAYIRAVQRTSSFYVESRTLLRPDPLAGQPLFEANCRQCHTQVVPLEGRLANRSMTDIAAELWNHAPKLLVVPMTDRTDMDNIVAYVWQMQAMGPHGSVAAGARVFANKGCVVCHNDPETGEPVVGRGDKIYTLYSMVSLGWDHGTRMQHEIKKKGMAWPRLSATDISDLLEYINSRP